MTARALALLTALLLGVVAHDAAAQTADDKAAAKKLYADATVAYKLGDFETALGDYQEAYREYAAPEFLFNIAQCHFQLGNWDQAIFFFEGYLRDLPKASNRALVEELIQEAKTNLSDAEKAAAEQQRRDEEAARLAAERKAAEDAVFARRAADAQKQAPPPHRETAHRPVYRKWWFWAVVGGVAAGTAATIAATSGGGTVLPSGSLGTWDER